MSRDPSPVGGADLLGLLGQFAEHSTDRVAHPTADDRLALGVAARELVPIDAHAEWHPQSGRPDPVAVLDVQNRTRIPQLVPIRHGRMMASPFTFYRGAAAVMAADLATTPTAGLAVQLCGDAHLSNFGGYAAPNRELVFDLNDFDETLPGPFEWDVKRMAASFAIAARNNGFSATDAHRATKQSVKSYRTAMAKFAALRTLDVWYARMSELDFRAAMRSVEENLLTTARAKGAMRRKREIEQIERAIKNADRAIRNGHARDSLHALHKLSEVANGEHRIASRPPILIPMRELAPRLGLTADEALDIVHAQFRAYRATLRDDCRAVLERFEVVDAALKVVGVGSVGTRAFIVLLRGRDSGDPLFLQVKEAGAAVLEAHLGPSEFAEAGERVVRGQRMMQAASDMFLGWTHGLEQDRFYYWRQLRDMKTSVVVEVMSPVAFSFYAQMCGWTLARAHARSGDPIAIAGYLGSDNTFDKAVTAFAERYADQNNLDHDTFVQAVRDGRIEAISGI